MKGKKKTKTTKSSRPGEDVDAVQGEKENQVDPEKPVDDIVEKTPYMECELRTGEADGTAPQAMRNARIPGTASMAERSSDVKNA